MGIAGSARRAATDRRDRERGPGSVIRLIRSPSISEVEVPFSARFHLGRSGRHPDGELIEGLRMSRAVPGGRTGASFEAWGPLADRPVLVGVADTGEVDFAHVPVMVDEVVDLLA